MEATDEKRDVRTPKIGDETGEKKATENVTRSEVVTGPQMEAEEGKRVVDEEKSNVNAAVSNEEKGDVNANDVTGTEMEATDEKRDVRTPKIGDETGEKKATENVTRSEVVSESAESEGQESEKKKKKGSNSDSYDTSTEDTTDTTDKDEKEKPAVSSEIQVKCFYKKDAKCDVTNETSSSDEIVFIKRDVKKVVVSTIELSTSEEENVVEKRSPDLCEVKFSQTKCRIKDTVPEERRRTRSEYQCSLARQFKNTSYNHPKNVNVGPRWDYFEDIDEIAKSDTSNTIKENTSDTTDKDRDSHDDESVMYVLISFYMFHLLLSRF